MNIKRTAILISGRGSNMQSLVKATRTPDYPASINLVISNKADAEGLDFASSQGIDTLVIDHCQYKTRADFDTSLDQALVTHNIDLVCLAGFMRILTADFVDKWYGRMINIHPSLLPVFPGLNTHKRALEAGAKEHGCTVHFVTGGVDEGPIIKQSSLVITPSETADSLAQRVLTLEHQLFPYALAMVAREEVSIN